MELDDAGLERGRRDRRRRPPPGGRSAGRGPASSTARSDEHVEHPAPPATADRRARRARRSPRRRPPRTSPTASATGLIEPSTAKQSSATSPTRGDRAAMRARHGRQRGEHAPRRGRSVRATSAAASTTRRPPPRARRARRRSPPARSERLDQHASRPARAGQRAPRAARRVRRPRRARRAPAPAAARRAARAGRSTANAEQVGQRLAALVLGRERRRQPTGGDARHHQRHHDHERRDGEQRRERHGGAGRARCADRGLAIRGNPIVAGVAAERPDQAWEARPQRTTSPVRRPLASQRRPRRDRGPRASTKTFRIPEHRIDSLKERARTRSRASSTASMRALRDVSFDVHAGRVLRDRRAQRLGQEHAAEDPRRASTAPTRDGSGWPAGVAPFIELGVGFNPELTARENGVLNGVLMGLTLREARRRLDAVLDFAELEEFVDLKLKNYSSGMLVRLRVRGDGPGGRRHHADRRGARRRRRRVRAEVHGRLPRAARAPGRTIVLVTHDMATVQTLCHRAMLLHDGELRYLGEPEDTALRYYRLNFARRGRSARGRRGAGRRRQRARGRRRAARRRRGERGRERRAGRADRGSTCVLEAARATSSGPCFGFHVRQRRRRSRSFGFDAHARRATVEPRPARRVRIAAPIENPLVPGRYFVDC